MSKALKKPQTPRERGLWPELGPTLRFDPQVDLLIRLDEDIYDWLTQFVGRNSYFFNVEEAITTALRALGAGRNPIDLFHLAILLAEEKGGYPGEELFGGRTLSEDARHAVGSLIWAAAMIACGKDETDLPEDEAYRQTVSDLLRCILH